MAAALSAIIFLLIGRRILQSLNVGAGCRPILFARGRLAPVALTGAVACFLIDQLVRSCSPHMLRAAGDEDLRRWHSSQGRACGEQHRAPGLIWAQPASRIDSIIYSTRCP